MRLRDLLRGRDGTPPSIFERLTWTCHVCMRERPDAEIKVVSSRVERPFVMQRNVRVCHDSIDCAQGAMEMLAEWESVILGEHDE